MVIAFDRSFQGASGGEPRSIEELVVAEGWSHYDLYDKPEPVKIALDKLIPFYTRVLGTVEATAMADQKVGKPAA